MDPWPWGTMGHPLRGASPSVFHVFAFARFAFRCAARRSSGIWGIWSWSSSPWGSLSTPRSVRFVWMQDLASESSNVSGLQISADHRGTVIEIDRNGRNERIVRWILHNSAEVMTGDDRCFCLKSGAAMDGVLRQVIMRSTWIASRRCRRALCGLC